MFNLPVTGQVHKNGYFLLQSEMHGIDGKTEALLKPVRKAVCETVLRYLTPDNVAETEDARTRYKLPVHEFRKECFWAVDEALSGIYKQDEHNCFTCIRNKAYSGIFGMLHYNIFCLVNRQAKCCDNWIGLAEIGSVFMLNLFQLEPFIRHEYVASDTVIELVLSDEFLGVEYVDDVDGTGFMAWFCDNGERLFNTTVSQRLQLNEFASESYVDRLCRIKQDCERCRMNL